MGTREALASRFPASRQLAESLRHAQSIPIIGDMSDIDNANEGAD